MKSLLVFLLIIGTLSLSLNGCTKAYNLPSAPQAPLPTATSTPYQTPVYQFTFASPGTGIGQLYNTHGITCDSLGNIYVADTSNYRVQKFDGSGNFITQWGTMGSGTAQFVTLNSVCIDSANNVYASDSANINVQKFKSDGTYITQWICGAGGSNDAPGGVAVDPSSGHIVVDEPFSQTIQKFTNTGTSLGSFTTSGSWDASASLPDGITCDSSGNIYTPDFNNDCVFKYSNSGTYLITIGKGVCGTLSCGINIDSQGILHVPDYSNQRVEDFKTDGTFLSQWGDTGPNAFGPIDYLTASPSGKIYVVDNDSVKVFGP